MKGIVFTEFLDLVEEKFGLETVQQIINEVETKSDGVYTAVGTYDHGEMFAMVSKLSEISGIGIPNLLEFYGEHFFDILASSYPQFMQKKDLFSFLETIDNYIHPEVLKLYPDAELPKFKAKSVDSTQLELIYQSKRKMIDFAVGLIKGAATYFEEKVDVQKSKINLDGEEVELKITKIG
ncbi:MAG: heme NO-binding domain-containing protein [Crocinitomicaceae bacterium]|nr:heme NO-binding domain-containing protein [Crocinitomicaceae bacterium]